MITWKRHTVHARTVFIGCKQEPGKPARYSWYIVDSATHQGWRYTNASSARKAADAAAKRLG